ncbi:MAG: transaldolase [Candidatus Atribacteria bacterium]|nr:MAG: transaldolase [Candidatus Atribacteria bacterium]
MNIEDMNIKIFADGADVHSMLKAKEEGIVKGFTTNPTLMRKAGVKSYEEFARTVLKNITDLPVSFEVLSDDFKIMEKEAREIGSWGENVYIKIPITNTKGEYSYPLIKKLSAGGLKINVTAILDISQVKPLINILGKNTYSIVSIFAGRIANTGRDPIPIMKTVVELFKERPKTEILWASPRELLNIFQANEIGCHIITVTNDILAKRKFIGMDLKELSLETVKLFYNDAVASGFKIDYLKE